MSYTEERIDILLDCYTDLQGLSKRLMYDVVLGETALAKFKVYETVINDLTKLKDDLKQLEGIK